MKITHKLTVLLFALLAMANIGSASAQTRTVKIVKGEEVLFSYPAEQIDFMTVVNQLEQPAGLKTELSETSITVTWNAVPGAEGYIVSRSGDGKNFTELAQVKATSYVDANPLSGENHYRVQAIGSGMTSSEMTTTSTPANFGQLESGMYVGIIGFNKKLYTLPIQLLNSSTKSKFDSYIDNLTNTTNGTALYYAVDNAISILQANRYSDDICNASIITFTDGLDNQSLSMQSDINYSTEEYLADVHYKLCNEKVQNKGISAYAVGVKGNDVTNNEEFVNNLLGLSSSEDNKKEANDMTEVYNTFLDIAKELYNTSFMQSVSVCIPCGYNQGTPIRFTFDVIRHGDELRPSDKALASELYIDANFYRTENGYYLRNLKCSGLTMEDMSDIHGYIVEEDGPNEGLACFTFNGIVCDGNKKIAKEKILQWCKNPFQIESEFEPDENTEVIEHKKTAAILLVLDCTESLDESSFKELKKCAKTFINTLVQGYQAPSDPSDPSDSSDPSDPSDSDTPTEPETPSYNGHEYVDLGLPSGLKWATCNIGASTPAGYGNYYAWGETTTKANYSTSTSTTYGKSISALQSSGIIDSDGNLTAQYDAASVNWGGSWRLPTMIEMQELVNNCTWTWTTESGTKGYKVKGPNGNTIFLPAAGYRYGSDLDGAGSDGSCWSSSVYSNDYNAYLLYFNSGNRSVDGDYRYYGQSLRPVSE